MQRTSSIVPVPKHVQNKGTQTTKENREARHYSSNASKCNTVSEITKLNVKMRSLTSIFLTATHAQTKATQTTKWNEEAHTKVWMSLSARQSTRVKKQKPMTLLSSCIFSRRHMHKPGRYNAQNQTKKYGATVQMWVSVGQNTKNTRSGCKSCHQLFPRRLMRKTNLHKPQNEIEEHCNRVWMSVRISLKAKVKNARVGCDSHHQLFLRWLIAKLSSKNNKKEDPRTTVQLSVSITQSPKVQNAMFRCYS